MTITIKSKEINRNYIEITQEKFSCCYKVILIDRYGQIDRQNICSTKEQAARCFYNYTKVAKTF